MSPRKPGNGAGGQPDNTSAYEMVGYQSLKPESQRMSRGIMGGWALQIGLASAMLILPMLVLTALLLAFVYGHRMPNHNSTYSYDNGTELALGAAYFVNYSATTLVYIASLSSTLATLLVSAAMILFSYSLARSMAQKSDANDASELPSPFQLQLLIRMVDGRITALWSYLLYVLGGRQRKVAVVPVLWQAAAMMSALVLLAGLITLADLWLHLSTKSVQYLEMKPQAAPDWFNPGRGVNQSCLDAGTGLFESLNFTIASCIVYPGDAVNQPVLVNQTEFVKTAGNLSELNRVYLGYYNELQYAVLGPAQIPENLDFEATSYGSHTECRMVTAECGAQTAFGDRDEPPSVFNFACNNTMAGLNMTGNFANLGQQSESYWPYVQNASSMAPKNVSSEMIIENVNTLSTSNFDFGFQYFFDSAKREQIPPSESYGSIGTNTTKNTTNQYFWALAFLLDIQLDISESTQNRNPGSQLNLVASAQGGPEGIMSCETNISEITYRMSQSALTILSVSPPRPNASIPFINGVTGSWGDEQLHQGLQQSYVRATSADQLASLFATVYDQTLVAIPAGVLNALPVMNATQRVQTQVARVPKAPFVSLLLLNCVFALVGVVLTMTALMAVGLGRRRTGGGVADAQARLSVAAVVAESFESPSLGEDARSVDHLFAERRGRVTRRVALGEGTKGGRRFRQVVVPGEKAEGENARLVSGRDLGDGGQLG